MRKLIISLCCLLAASSPGFGQSMSFKTYKNPVIPGDHPDCTLTKIGNDYYTTGSSFNVTPVIYHSTDLVHWEAVAQPVSASWTGYGDAAGGGCWGGQMVYHNGKYWDYFSRSNTMYFVTADQPQGPWTLPTRVNNPPQLPYALGYDNSIFIDDDGKWYLVVKNGKPNNGIVELGNDGQPTGVVYDLNWLNPDPNPYSWAEGPVMWKYQGYYYYSFARDLGGHQYWMRSSTLTADQSSWSTPVEFFNQSDPLKSGSLFEEPNHSSSVVMIPDSTNWVVHPLYAKSEWKGQGRQGLLNQVHYDANGKPTADYPVNTSFTAPKLPSSGIPWMVPHSDFFNSTALNAEWSHLGYTPDNLYSLIDRAGWLRLSPKTGKYNTVIKNDGEHNYSLITRLDFNATATSDEAGLLVMRGDETSNAKLYSSINASGHKAIFFSFNTSKYEVDTTVGDTVWLKITRINHLISGYFSSDGYSWSQVGSSFDVSSIDSYSDFSTFTGTRQGLYVQNSPAYFDFYIYRDAYTPILSECPANQYGTTITSRVGGISSLDNIHDGDWALYAGVEFGNTEYIKQPDSVLFTASSASTGGTVEVWLDSLDSGTKIAECAIAPTGSWTAYNTFAAKIQSPVSGNHDVYLKFKGSGSDKLFILQWMTFIAKPGGYRSHQSGSWNDINTWEKFDGISWQYPAPDAPGAGGGTKTIQNGHRVKISESDTADQLIIEPGGTLQIGAGDTLVVNDGLWTDLTVRGALVDSGIVKKEDAATVSVDNGGKYTHARDGGEIPFATWAKGSTCEITGVVSNVPANTNQSFFNFAWNCPGQTSNMNVGWNGITIGGNINISNTGTGAWKMCDPTASIPAVINVGGDINQSGGVFVTHTSPDQGTTVTINQSGSLNVTGGSFYFSGDTGTGTIVWNLGSGNLNESGGMIGVHTTDQGGINVIVNQGGNINITGGIFRFSGSSQNGTGILVWHLTGGNFSIVNAQLQTHAATPLGTGFIFMKTGMQTLTIDTGNTISALPIEVNSRTILNIGTSELKGSGHFYLDPGATLVTAHAGGIDGNIQTIGSKMLSTSANYTYSGAAAQVTGALLPDTVGNLTLDNSSGLTLQHTVTVNDTLEIRNGVLSPGGNVLRYGVHGTLKYSRNSAVTTTDAEFPQAGGPANLIIANPAGLTVTLHASRLLSGNLNLVGGRLAIGANMLTVSSTTGASVSKYVITDGTGMLRLSAVDTAQTIIPLGTTYLGSLMYAPVWIANSGDVDTIGATVVADTASSQHGGRVMVKWNLNEGTAGGGNYTLQFGWMSSLEDIKFTINRSANARIFHLTPDTMEAGTGPYTSYFTTLQPYHIARAGITTLGWFAVGKFSDSVTSVDHSISGLPKRFALNQNYPNPFNPTTVIGYQLPVTSRLSLRVYNVLGQEVTTLFEGSLGPGNYTATFDGNRLASGVYYVKIDASPQDKGTPYAKTIRMLLLK
jgi:xylan 1,4-beta-xylosidase